MKMNKNLIKIFANKLHISPRIYYKLYNKWRDVSNKKNHKKKKIKLVKSELEEFSVKSIAILTDGGVNIKEVVGLSKEYAISLFSMNLDVVGEFICNVKVMQLNIDNALSVDIDAWMVCSTSDLYAYSLSQFLYDHDLSEQIVFNYLSHNNQTKYYSNADFFSGRQKTIVRINNYYERLYNIYYPIPFRVTLRDLKGGVVKKFQIIIPADHIYVLDSEDLDIGEFTGMLEVEYEINSKTIPFLHYMVDYINSDAISSNHQAGLGLTSPGYVFVRGFIPEEDNKTLVVSFFQNNYIRPIVVDIVLYYFNGSRHVMKKMKTSNLFKNTINYFDIKKMFNDVDFSNISNARVEFSCKHPINRPNFYYKKYGDAGYYDTSHSAAPEAFLNRGLRTQSEMEVKKIIEQGYEPFDIRLHSFPSSVNVDTYIMLSDEASCKVNELNMIVFNEKGVCIDIGNISCWYDDVGPVNLSKIIRDRHGENIVGSISLRPSNLDDEIPIFVSGVGGYMLKNNKYMTSTVFDASTIKNTPFYYRGSDGGGLLLQDTAIPVSDVFCRGVCDNEFDTMLAITYDSPNRESNNKISISIEVITSIGEKNLLYFNIVENGTLYLTLSDLLEQCKYVSDDGNYTLWFITKGFSIYPKHLLIRKKDMACAIEHTYVGKYGM